MTLSSPCSGQHTMPRLRCGGCGRMQPSSVLASDMACATSMVDACCICSRMDSDSDCNKVPPPPSISNWRALCVDNDVTTFRPDEDSRVWFVCRCNDHHLHVDHGYRWRQPRQCRVRERAASCQRALLYTTRCVQRGCNAAERSKWYTAVTQHLAVLC